MSRAEERDRALRLAMVAARMAGLAVEGVSVIRQRSSITLELHGADVMARVEDREGKGLAARQVEVARVLEDRSVPAVRLVVPEQQPFLFEDGAVTLWKRLTILPGEAEPDVLAQIVRRLHDATRTDLPAAVPPLDPFYRIRADLGRAGERSAFGEIDDLVADCEKVAEEWEETVSQDPLGTVLVHGDFHVENVVLTPVGPVLLDLEDAGRGPATWDLVAQLVAVRRFGLPEEECAAFCETYGADPNAWEGTDLLCRGYELLLLAWAMAYADTSPGMAAEAAVRLASYRGETNRFWTLQ